MNFVFDLYGTLIDIWTDESGIELWEGVATLIGDVEENAEQVREEYLSLCNKAYRGGNHELDLSLVFEQMLARRGLESTLVPSLASEFRRLSMVHLGCFRGVKTMLGELKKKGAGVYLISNAQACFTYDELHTCGLYDLFDGILLSSEVQVKKPDKAIFEIGFEKFGISAENSIYVGNDMRDDILGATGVGMSTVYIQTRQSGNHTNLDLPEPTYKVASHKEMKELLLSLA